MDHNRVVKNYAESLPIARLEHQNIMMRFALQSQLALYRVSSFETKEPETVKWISGFSEDDVFVDIGANMGLYTIFASVFARARVFSFEPESQNYALLNRNIQLNKVADRVVAWCCALSNERKFDRLYMAQTHAAGSGHEFGAEVTPELKPARALFAQGSMSITLDDLVKEGAVPQPRHVKIDVDGFEHLVVAGALNTFENRYLSSVLIEISPHLDQHAKLISDMHAMGFNFDPEQVENARRKEGNTKDYAEYIFRR